MRYYDCGGYPLCSREVLALPALHALPEAGEVLFGFHRTPGAGRDTFPVTAPSLLTAEEMMHRQSWMKVIMRSWICCRIKKQLF